MSIGKNRIKYLSSLKIKKFRDENRQFIIEGDKIVTDTLRNPAIRIDQLIATATWLNTNRKLITGNIKETLEASPDDISRVTSFETAPPVLALLDIPEVPQDWDEIHESLSIGLYNVQDPGNLGTIIRTCDWFGIRNVFCSRGCADIYNPKVIQASMGAVLNIRVHYMDLLTLLQQLKRVTGYMVAGTFMQGIPIQEIRKQEKGMVLFGNESRGISAELENLLDHRITILPAGGRTHVESLNVASSVAIILNRITR